MIFLPRNRRGELDASTEKFSKRLRQFARFSKYLLPYWDKQAALLLCMVFSTLFGLTGPYLAKLTIDYAYGNRDLTLFNAMVLSGIVIYLLSGLLGVVLKYVSAFISLSVDFDLRSEVYSHLQRLSLRFFQGRTTGEQMFRMSNDISGVAGVATGILPTVLTVLVRLVFLLILTLWLNWKMAVMVMAVVPLFYLHSHYFGKKLQKVSRELRDKSQDIYSGLQESISHTKLIKAFGKEKSEVHRYLDLWTERIGLTLKKTKVSALSGGTGGLLSAAVTTSLSYYVGYNVIKGEMSLGTLVALLAYMTQLLGVFKSLGAVYQEILVSFVSVDRVLETLDAGVEVRQDEDAADVYPLSGPIEFKDVSFGYDPEKPILKNISFDTENGKAVALVGLSGAGKSTIVGLLLRLFDAWSGEILLGGTKIRKLTLKSLRDQVGVVLQDHFIMNGTIADNVRFGKPSASDEEILEAVRIADAEEFVMKLPQGFDTIVGEDGCNLSEGQKQRIAIARAIVRKPRILILDEATSSVSGICEARIRQNLKAWDPNLTVLIISHGLSKVKDADLILVLHEGCVVEKGTHQELVAQDGLYQKLYLQQFGDGSLGTWGISESASEAWTSG